MNKRDPFWRRALGSVRQFLNRPIGGESKPSPRKVKKAEVETEPPPQEAPDTQPSLSRIAEPARKQLWGQEFDIVDEGLSEEQVAEVVGSLMSKCRDLEEQQKHFLSLGSLTERAAIDADKAAATIKARAKAEAEAEAARIIAQANERTQEMLVEAKKAAQEATRQEVQDILQSALRKAAIVELQAKQQAQIFLIRSRDSIEGDLREEIKEAYYRLLSGLHNVLGAGNQLELEWKDKTKQLRTSETFELPSRAEPYAALATEIAATSPFVDEEEKAEISASEEIEGN